MILGYLWIHALNAFPSTIHQHFRYPTEDRAKELYGEKTLARECYIATLNATKVVKIGT